MYLCHDDPRGTCFQFCDGFDLCDMVRDTRVSRHIRWTLVVDVMVVRTANVCHLVGYSELSTFPDFQS